MITPQDKVRAESMHHHLRLDTKKYPGAFKFLEEMAAYMREVDKDNV